MLPISVQNPKAIRSGLRVRLDDGRSVPATASFVWAATNDRSTGWTRTTPVWNLSTPAQYLKNPPTMPGTWIAMIDLPIDAVGQGIWIDETRYEPNWLPAPARVILESSAHDQDGFWDAALSETQLRSIYVNDAIANLRVDPFNSWRAKLMTEGFSPDSGSSTTPAHSDRDLTAIHTELLQSNSAQGLEYIADHFTARWQIILGRIWLINPQVGAQLKHQLSRTITADGQIVPMWTDDTAQLSALAHDLLSPFVNDELRVERVIAWLETQPQSMSWVIDDSGHPTRHPFTLTQTIGTMVATPLTKAQQSQLARVQSVGIEPVVEMIPSGSIARSTLVAPSAPTPTYAQVNDPRIISIQVGNQRSRLKSMGDVPLASPPGVLIGPALNDWTLHAFGTQQSSLGALPDPPYRVAGLVHRVADIDELDPRAGWRVYLECAIDPKSSIDTNIQIWIGPMNSSRVAWTISRKLGLVELRSDADINIEPIFTSTTDGDRWILEIDLPPQAISNDGFLVIGLEREDGNRHSSWPRRMMPWQDEPGRFAIDITGWTGASQAP